MKWNDRLLFKIPSGKNISSGFLASASPAGSKKKLNTKKKSRLLNRPSIDINYLIARQA